MRIIRAALTVLAFAFAAQAGAVEFALNYLSLPVTFNYVQTDLVTLEQVQENQRMGISSFGLRISQDFPPVSDSLPLRFGLETGFCLPAGSQSFDERERVINADAAGATKTASYVGDSFNWSTLAVPLLATATYLPPVPVLTINAQAGVGVVFTDTVEEHIQTFYTGPLEDFDYKSAIHSHLFATSFALELTGGVMVPLTEALCLKFSGGMLWLSTADFSTTVTDAGGDDWVEGLQVGGIGMSFRAGISASL